MAQRKVRLDKLSLSPCSLTRSMSIIGTKWKPVIIHTIHTNTLRFGQIAAMIPLISRKVLANQLKELEEDGIINRRSFEEVPRRVEYSLHEKGLGLIPILKKVVDWNFKYEQEQVLTK